LKKVKFKILILILLFTSISSSTINIKDNFVKNKDFNSNLDDFYNNKIHLAQSSLNSSSNWWNSLYNYRIPINITNINTDTIPQGYSVNISINTIELISSGKLRNDGNDLRIVWYNSSNKAWLEIDRINESNFNTIDTQIWFKTQDTINPETSDTNYYLYYGNPYALSPPMNRSNIYDFFNDFTQVNGPANGWSTISGTWSVYNYEYRENSGSQDCTSLLDSYNIQNSSIEVRVKTNGNSFGVGVKFRYYNESNFFCAGLGYWDKEISYGKQNESGWLEIGFDGADESNLISDQWYDLKIESIGNHHKIYLDGLLRIDEIHNDHLDYTQIGFLTWTTNTSYYDDLKIRLLMSPEPTLTLGNEEIYRHSSDDFLYYKTFSINSSKVMGSTNLIDFPLLISIEDYDLRHHCRFDGNDIAFSNGTVWLDHEIELFNQTFNGTHAKLVAWVRIPSLSPTIDTNITMYYGNSTMNSQENPTGVWDDNYVGVWHLSEDPTGIIYDSTSNNNDGNSYGSMDNGDQILGKIDGSINFDGNDDNIATEENNLLAGCSSLTMSAWIKPLETQSDFCGIIEYDNSTDGSSFDAGMELRETGEPRVNIWTTSGFEYVDSSVPLPTTQFTYFVFVYDGDLNIYLDGSSDSSTPHNGTIRNNRRYINIGRNTHDGRSFNGTIDEIHISNINRSADWIATEYNNQYDPNSFYSVGKENARYNHPLNHEYFKYYKEIIIDHTKINGFENLINFPVLISILDSDLHDQNKVQEYGNDIAFGLNNIWLDHEIEYFNQTYSGTQAKLVVWVRIPLLSPFTDTIIEMYYGNSTMNSRQNPTEVWDDNFVGVWHLSEDPTGTVYDSTSNNNDGISYGSMNSTDQVTGKIDGSLEFDGDNDYIDCGNDNSLDITGDITIEFWVNGESFSDDLDPDILTKGNYTQAYSTWINDDGGVYFQLNGDSLVSTYKLPLGVWYNVVCTRSGSNRRIYINGTLDISDTFSNAIETITDILTIARSPDNLNGTLDEIRLSNVSRSAEWIATEYNNQYETDSFYSIGTENIIVEDTSAPDISINSPNPDDLFGWNAPNYNLTVTDANFDSIWYSLDSGATNSTPVAATGIIDQTMWGAQPSGDVTIRFYANDTYGNFDYEEVKVEKDTIAPTIDITEPLDYELFGNIPPNVTVIINDAHLDTILYQLENASVITSNYTWTGFIAQSVWDQVGNGTVTISFYANDTLGNLNYTYVEVYKDIYVPIITIDIPSFDNVYNETAPNFVVDISGSNLDARWYTLDDGLSNHTFLGLTGIINQSAWDDQGDGTVIIKFYLNNTLGVVGFDEVSIIKDTLNPTLTLNLPLNNTYWGEAPIINVLATDANLDSIWYEVNTSIGLLGNDINQQLDPSIWSDLLEGEFYVYIYANDSVGHLNDSLVLVLHKDTIAPSVPILIDFPTGNVNGTLIFDWNDGSDPSGIIKYRLIIDNEPNPLTTPGYIFEVNVTESYYEYTEILQPGDYYFFLYQIDGAGNQGSAAYGSFTILSSSPSSPPPEFPFWIIIVIIGAAVGGVVGIVVLKKSKSKKTFIAQIPEKKPEIKPKLEIHEELRLLDYEVLKNKSREELNTREEKLLEYIKTLEENKEYTKEAEFIGQLMIIENILGNYEEEQLYRQKQIDVAVKGLEYLKDQYEIESKKAAVSGDYSKALELYNESKLISDNLKMYLEGQETSNIEDVTIEEPMKTIEIMEPQLLRREVGIVYSCINDLLTKFFDEIGIKYYSNPQIYDDVQNQIHGLILADNELIANIDPTIINKIKSIQIIYTEDISYENIVNLCKQFQSPEAMLIIVGIKWPEDTKPQTIEVPLNNEIRHQENIRIIHHELFFTLIGLKGVYATAFNEIIDLYNRSELDILRETHESSEIIIHNTDELINDLKEQGLIEYNLNEFFHR
jgi:hypothetical protein